MNPETLLALLPNSKDDALSLNEIALAMGLDVSSYTAMDRIKRQLSRVLRTLVKQAHPAASCGACSRQSPSAELQQVHLLVAFFLLRGSMCLNIISNYI
jgi:hypothetical protein